MTVVSTEDLETAFASGETTVVRSTAQKSWRCSIVVRGKEGASGKRLLVVGTTLGNQHYSVPVEWEEKFVVLVLHQKQRCGAEQFYGYNSVAYCSTNPKTWQSDSDDDAVCMACGAIRDLVWHGCKSDVVCIGVSAGCDIVAAVTSRFGPESTIKFTLIALIAGAFHRANYSLMVAGECRKFIVLHHVWDRLSLWHEQQDFWHSAVHQRNIPVYLKLLEHKNTLTSGWKYHNYALALLSQQQFWKFIGSDLVDQCESFVTGCAYHKLGMGHISDQEAICPGVETCESFLKYVGAWLLTGYAMSHLGEFVQMGWYPLFQGIDECFHTYQRLFRRLRTVAMNRPALPTDLAWMRNFMPVDYFFPFVLPLAFCEELAQVQNSRVRDVGGRAKHAKREKRHVTGIVRCTGVDSQVHVHVLARHGQYVLAELQFVGGAVSTSWCSVSGDASSGSSTLPATSWVLHPMDMMILEMHDGPNDLVFRVLAFFYQAHRSKNAKGVVWPQKFLSLTVFCKPGSLFLSSPSLKVTGMVVFSTHGLCKVMRWGDAYRANSRFFENALGKQTKDPVVLGPVQLWAQSADALRDVPPQNHERLAELLSKLRDSTMHAVVGPAGTGKTVLMRDAVLSFMKYAANNSPKSTVFGVAPTNMAINRLREVFADTAAAPDFLQLVANSREIEDVGVQAHLNTDRLHGFLGESRNKILVGTPGLLSKAPSVYGDHLDVLHRLPCALCFIDEAGQVADVNAVALALYGKSVIAIGDPRQLPAFSRCSASPSSLMRQLLMIGKPQFLSEQHRSVPCLGEVVSQCFYAGKLVHGKQEDSQVSPFVLVVVPDSADAPDVGSPYAAAVAADLLAMLPFGTSELVHLSFYAAQKKHFQAAQQGRSLQVKCGTVDSLQGYECSVSIADCTRRSGIGFTGSKQRMCVSITRSRVCSVLFVHENQLTTNTPAWWMFNSLDQLARQFGTRVDLSHEEAAQAAAVRVFDTMYSHKISQSGVKTIAEGRGASSPWHSIADSMEWYQQDRVGALGQVCGPVSPPADLDAVDEACMIRPSDDDDEASEQSDALEDEGAEEEKQEAVSCASSNLYFSAVDVQFARWGSFARVSILNAGKLAIGQVDVYADLGKLSILRGIFCNVCDQMREGYASLKSQYQIPHIPVLSVEGSRVSFDFNALLTADDATGLLAFFGLCIKNDRFVYVKKLREEKQATYEKLRHVMIFLDLPYPLVHCLLYHLQYYERENYYLMQRQEREARSGKFARLYVDGVGKYSFVSQIGLHKIVSE